MSWQRSTSSPPVTSAVFRWLLPALALLAIVFAPLARILHEQSASHDHSAHVAEGVVHATDGADHDQPHHPPTHDADHCTTCATISSLRQVTSLVAFVFHVSVEPAPTFVVAPYLAPTTCEPVIALAIPRGPPIFA